MSQTYYKIWIHLVWGTKDAHALLTKEIRQGVFDHIREKAQREGYHLDIINGVSDHVHCLLSLQPRLSISEIVNKLKGESSHWINSAKLTPTHFAWQGGFGAFSVGEADIARVRKYIQEQEENHRHRSYAEEVQELVREFQAIHASSPE